MVLNQAEDDYAMIKVHVQDGFINYDRFKEIIRNLNFDATPGYPLCRSYPTIADMFKWDGFNVDPHAVERFWFEWLVWLSNPIDFPFRMFIKDEPINQKKFDLGRWRLIFASPLYYQILDHFLFDEMNEKEMENQWNVPTKLQWHPFWGGAEIGVASFDDPVSIDKSMWDWTALWELISIDKDFRKSMANAPPYWHQLVDLSYELEFEKASFVFSSGIVVRQNFKGLMKSGLLNTLSTNSHCQDFIHKLAQLRCGHNYNFWTIGDDVLMTNPCENYKQQLNQFSIVKEIEPGYKFAGFDLSTKTPTYWSKHYNRLLYSTEEEIAEILDSYQRLYAFHPEKLKLIHKILYDYAPNKLRTPRFLRVWATYNINLGNIIIH